MKLFHWKNTKVNKLYSNGDIIVMAKTLSDAIDIVKLQILKETSVGYTNVSWLMDSFDIDDIEELETIKKILEEDLKNPPFIYESATAIFINGGE